MKFEIYLNSLGSGLKYCARTLFTRKPGIGLLLFVFLFGAWQARGQVSGKVFRDFNNNGVRDSSATLVETGIQGVVVTASDGTSTATAITNTSGDYLFSNSGATASGKKVRIVFSNLLPGDVSAPHGPSSGTSVQFVTAGSEYWTAGGLTANFGVNYPSQYCQTNPLIATSCFVSGNPAAGSEVAQREVLVSLLYSASGYNFDHGELGLAGQLGSVMGLAYQRSSNKLFSAAFTKRHVGFGPGGPGAVYVTQLMPDRWGATSSEVFFNFGSTAGADPHDPTLPTTTANKASRENNVFDAVGKMGLGDIDISDDDKTLFVVNLFNRRLYKLDIATRDTVGYAIPNPGCQGGSYRPFALKYYRGAVYVGVVCSQEGAVSKTDTAGMKATVYKFESGGFTPVLSFPLTYKKQPTNADLLGIPRAEYWRPWTSTYQVDRNHEPNGGPVSYPQPWLTDIEFDVNGDMVLGIRDRFGDQIGHLNLKPFASDSILISAISPGEILRAGKCTSADVWTIENNGSVCGGAISSAQDSQQGPGGGKYYFGDMAIEGENHGLSSLGTLALLPGSGTVLMSSIAPAGALGTGGLKRLVNKDGSQHEGGGIPGGASLYSSTALGYGKANGVGDIELLCDPAPIEIGNRVWLDTNGNGAQDPGEPGIPGVSVELCLASNPSSPLATAITDAEGNYYFSSAMGTSNASVKYGLTILPKTAYILKFPSAFNGNPLSPGNAVSNDLIDSDANMDGRVHFSTDLPGENNHSCDVGYKTCDSPVWGTASVTAATCNGPNNGNDASFTLSGISGANRYSYATSVSGLVSYASATSLSSGTLTVDNLPNPVSAAGQSYVIRLFNASDNCFRDTTVLIPYIVCQKTYDLALDKSVNTKLASLGDEVSFTLRVWNEGTGTAHGIQVTDSLHAGVQYLRSVAERGAYVSSSGIWAIDSLVAGDTVSLTITVRVVAQGVWFNTAEITRMSEDDLDSTPNNKVDGEDDLDRECFTVPVLLCNGQGSEVTLTVPGQYSGVVWFRKEQNGTPVQVGTGNTYKAFETVLGSYEYSFTSTSGSCPAEGCCPVIIVVQDCCPEDVCVPFVITKKKK